MWAWLLAVLSPPIVLGSTLFIWTRVSTRDPALMALVGVQLTVLYLGFLLGLGMSSCL